MDNYRILEERRLMEQAAYDSIYQDITDTDTKESNDVDVDMQDEDEEMNALAEKHLDLSDQYKLFELNTFQHCRNHNVIMKSLKSLKAKYGSKFATERLQNFPQKLFEQKQMDVLEEFLNHIIDYEAMAVPPLSQWENYIEYLKLDNARAMNDMEWNVWNACFGTYMADAIILHSNKMNTLYRTKIVDHEKRVFYQWNGFYFNKYLSSEKSLETALIAPIIDNLLPHIIKQFVSVKNKQFTKYLRTVGSSNDLSRVILNKIRHRIAEMDSQKFDHNKYIFLDKNKNTFSLLLSTSDGEAIRIQNRPRHLLSRAFITVYNPRAQPTDNVLSTLEIISNNSKPIEIFLLQYVSGMLTSRHEKYILVLRSQWPGCGKSSFAELIIRTIGQAFVSDIPANAFWTKKNSETHDSALTHSLAKPAFGGITKDYDSGHGTQYATSAPTCKLITGETEVTKRPIFSPYRVFVSCMTQMFHTNDKKLKFSYVDETISDKIIWIEVVSRLVDLPSDVNKENLQYLKVPGIIESWEKDCKSRQYMLTRLVAAACSVVNDSQYLVFENLPKHVQEHSKGKHLTTIDCCKFNNRHLTAWIDDNAILKSEKDDYIIENCSEDNLYLSLADSVELVFTHNYERKGIDYESVQILKDAFSNDIKRYIRENVCTVTRKKSDTRRYYEWCAHKF